MLLANVLKSNAFSILHGAYGVSVKDPNEMFLKETFRGRFVRTPRYFPGVCGIALDSCT